MGVIASGTGVAACVLKPLAGKLINPNGLVAVEGAFPDAVYARWPPVLRVLGLLCGILTVIGGFLQTNPPSFAGSYPARDRLARVAELALARLTRGAAPTPCKQKLRGQSGSTLPTARPRQALGQAPAAVGFSRRLGVMWLMILTSAASGLSIASTYRVIGRRHPHLDSDSFLSVVGATSALIGNAAGRFFWGHLSDVRGFKTAFLVLALVQAACMLAFTTLACSRLTFLIGTSLMLFCMGGDPCTHTLTRGNQRVANPPPA